ncbi:MAG: hypothetical protein K6T75_03450 [Acetobacteraceae bacterium]|nr:hypothetical protein [Acetobacteraceae bacterium]
MPFAALAAASLGLPGPGQGAAQLCADKGRMREALEAAGVPGPRFARVASFAGASRAAAGLGYPVVLKLPSGIGSSGVVWVEAEAVWRRGWGSWGGAAARALAA